MKPEELKEFGWITFALERVFFALQFLSPANLLFRTRLAVQSAASWPQEMRALTVRRAWLIDSYIAFWLVVEIVSAFAIPSASRPIVALLFGLSAFRIFEILQATINMNVFDRLRFGSRPHYIASVARTLILSIINFVELIVCFGVVYAFHLPELKNASQPFDPFYFSAITQLTIGYGDILPTGALKYYATLQGLFGFLFAIVILARFVSFLPPAKTILGDD